MSSRSYSGFEIWLIRFAAGWIVSFVLLFNLIGLFIESIRWQYEIFILPVLCLSGAIFFFPLLSKWLTKRIAKAVRIQKASKTLLRFYWAVNSLPLWTKKERERFWVIWYDAAYKRTVADDPLLEHWLVILKLAEGEPIEEEAALPAETAPEAVEGVLPAKVLTSGLQPAAYRTTTAPEEAPVATVSEKVEPAPAIPIEPVSPPRVYRFEFEKWHQLVMGSHKKPAPPIPEKVEEPQPSGVVEELDVVHPQETELTTHIPESIVPELADTDTTVEFVPELPAPEPVSIVEEEVTEEVTEAELTSVTPEVEVPLLAESDVPVTFEPEAPKVEVPPVEAPPPVRMKPEVSVPFPFIPPPKKPQYEAPVPESKPKFQYTPPKLPPLPEHPSFARKPEESGVSSTTPAKTVPARVYGKKPRFNRENAKQLVLTILLIVLILVAGLGVFGLFRFVVNSVSTEPQLAAEATIPEPVQLQSLKFTLDIGERATIKEANQELEALQNNGFAAYLYRELKRDGKIHMRVGHFARKRDAQEVGRKMIDQKFTKRFEIVSSDSGTVTP